MTKAQTIVSWTLQFIAAAILFQTLFFKFTGAAESKFIFQTLGVEPWGRIALGVVEFIAVLLLLVPRTAAIGAMLALGLMGGAICCHATKLGLVVQGDGGLLFALSLTVFVGSAVVLVLRRREVRAILNTPLHRGPCPCSTHR